MAGITLAQAQQQLDASLVALAAARTQQEYQIISPTGGRKVTRGPLAELQKQVEFWEQRVRSLSGAGGGVRTSLAVPQ